jgi:asparagine synthase (glutamine-hydrolysing)
MSGVCGVVRLDGGPVEAGELVAMASAAAHRGRDGGGRVLLDAAGFAWQALRVTPEDVGDAQPVRVGDLVVVADARLDDRAGLVRSLGAGAPPGDAPDSVLIAAAWQRWGEGAPERLLGDFAVVVYDVAARVLHAFRDPMGMRPLHFLVEPRRRVLVGSEVKQVLAASGVPVRIFEPAVAAHLAGPFVPPTWTFYEGVEALGPGEALRVDAEGGVRRRVWWALDPEERIVYRDLGAYAEHFRELLLTAVADRLRSVGPVGVLLSGGVDSGSVAASAGWLREQGRAHQTDLRTYSFAYTTVPECDERAISAITVDRYGLRATDIPTHDAWPLCDMDAHGPDLDGPSIGVYQPLIDRALEAASEDGVGPLLGGDRGDLLVGPTGLSYVRLLARGDVRATMEEIGNHRRVLGDPLPSILWRHLLLAGLWHLRRRRQVAQGPGGEPSDPVPGAPWIDPGFADRIGLPDMLARAEVASPVRDHARAQRYRSVFHPYQMQGMTWSERGYARYGVAFADPFSDLRLARFAVAVPAQVLTAPSEFDKPLAREAMRGIMPEGARRRAAKIEPAPFLAWALQGPATEAARSLGRGTEMAMRGWVDAEPLRERVEAVVAGAPIPALLWNALTLESWLRLHHSHR